MSTYLFFPPADKAQDDIWRYTCETWGESQAEKYLAGLHNHLQELVKKLRVWQPLPDSLVVPPDLGISAYFSRYEHHYIFFRELSDNRIGVLSILHASMNIPVRLSMDLEKIESLEQP